jgi:hypothetical protein
MTTAALPTEFALSRYQAALTGLLRPAPAPDAERPAAADDRGSLLDLVIGPRRATSLRPALRMRALAALPTRQCLPLTAASGC